MFAPNLIQILPPNGNGGSNLNNLVLKINPQKYTWLKNELKADKLYIVYEDKRSVIIAGYNGSRNPKMIKVPKAWLFSDIKSLVSIIPHK